MNSAIALQTAASVIATYAIHSTLLLLVAWLLDRFAVKRAAVRERLWKWGTVIPLFSTTFVLCWPQSQPIWEWRSDLSPNRVVAAVEPNPNAIELAHVNVLSATNETTEFVAPTAVTEFDNDDGPLLPEITIESVNLSSSGEPATPETAVSDVDSELKQDWVVQIVPGEATAKPHTLPVNSRSDVGRSVAPPAMPVEDNQPAVSTIASTPGDPSATTEGAALPSAKQAAQGKDVSFACLLIAVIAASFAVLGIIRFVISQVRITRILGSSQTISDGQAAKLLKQLLTRRNIKQSVRLLSSDVVSEPAATGVLRWTIVLPSELPSRLSNSELSALLCHELGHLVRRDTVWLLFGRLITAMLPWQLLNFVAIQKWQQSAEMECDEWTLSSNVEALTLARVLTNVAEWKTSNRLRVGLPATAPPLSLRIEALLNRGNGPPRPRSKLQKFLFTTMLIGTLCGVSGFGPRMTWASPKNETLDSAFDNLPRELTATETQQLSELRTEFRALSADLQVALELLAEQETDPDIDKTIHKITNRLEQIEANIHQEGFEQ